MRLKKSLLLLVFFLAATTQMSLGAAHRYWRICDLTVKILRIDGAKHSLRAAVQKLEHSIHQAQCPAPGRVLEFTPETPGYQSKLPRGRWPAVAETAALQYRYLDGECHLDGRDGPCRVTHYSMPR
jgi:hypothetical protein